MLRKDLILVGLITCILLLIVVPLPPALIDVLLALNITLSIIMLLVGLYLKNPSDFSTFPSVILIGTAFRLALSIATTRLILTEAEGGEIIETFGEFVVGGYVAVGLVIFLVITVVQFMVVTKGAERVAEVAARFTLDALPGKQMSIDADIRAGTLTAAEGEKMRTLLGKESQFFGSMDGAMKFIKGDAIAGLIIVFINLIGGMIVGVAIHGMTFSESAELFSLLTVGDGLVSQIPALLMSLCAGMIVTRATGPENTDLGSDISKELMSDSRVLGVASVLVFGMGLIPGFPLPIFATVAVLLAISALALARKTKAAAQAALAASADVGTAAGTEVAKIVEEPSTTIIQTPPVVINNRFKLWIGSELAGTLDLDLMQSQICYQFERLRYRTGISFATPGIGVHPRLAPWGISVDLDEVPLISDVLPQNPVLFLMSPDQAHAAGIVGPQALHWPTFDGIAVSGSGAMLFAATDHPAFSLADTLSEQVFRLFERHLGALFSRREFDLLVEDFALEDAAGLAAIDHTTKRATLFQVVQMLVEDGVPLRPLRLVIDALQYWTQIPEVTSPSLLADCLRGSLKRQLCHSLIGPEGVLGVVLMDPEFEGMLRKLTGEIRKSPATSGFEGLPLPTEMIEPALTEFRRIAQVQREPGHHLVVVIGADLRRRLRNFLAANEIQLPVFAPHEIPTEVRTLPIEVLRMPSIRSAGPRISRVA